MEDPLRHGRPEHPLGTPPGEPTPLPPHLSPLGPSHHHQVGRPPPGHICRRLWKVAVDGVRLVFSDLTPLLAHIGAEIAAARRRKRSSSKSHNIWKATPSRISPPGWTGLALPPLELVAAGEGLCNMLPCCKLDEESRLSLHPLPLCLRDVPSPTILLRDAACGSSALSRPWQPNLSAVARRLLARLDHLPHHGAPPKERRLLTIGPGAAEPSVHDSTVGVRGCRQKAS